MKNEDDSTEISKVTDYKTRINKQRKITVLLVALFSAIIVIGTIAATAHLTAQFFKGSSYSTQDIAEYRNYTGHIKTEQEGFFSLLEIFPNEILPSSEVKNYYYFCNNGNLDNSYQLYLLCSYEESDFLLEKERLESIEFTFKNTSQKPIITDAGFDCRAVVTIFDDQNSFEYALIDDNTNTIAYVFAQSMGIDSSVVPSQYRPKGFDPPKEYLTEWGGYNVYRFKLDDSIIGPTYVIPGIDSVSE